MEQDFVGEGEWQSFPIPYADFVQPCVEEELQKWW
jgi:hypothetical protein